MTRLLHPTQPRRFPGARRRRLRRSTLVVALCASAVTALAPTSPVPSISAASDGFAPLERPARLVDTRVGATTIDGAQQGDGLRPAGSVTEVRVAGRAGLPTDASVVVLNATVTEAQAAGYLTVWPCDTDRPVASNLNFVAGQTIANQVFARVGANGRVCVFTSAPTHLIVDAAGTFAGSAAPAMLNVPTRLLDSRTTAIAAAGSTTRVLVRGRPGVAADARVAVLNVTVTEPTTAGFVTVFPCGADRPNASTLNFTAGATVANAAIAGIGSSGEVCLYTSATTHLVLDIAGVSSADAFSMLPAPARVLDTRAGSTTIDGLRSGDGLRGAGGAIALEVAGRAGVPSTAGAVILNVTVTGALGSGFVTAHACGTARPNASNLNYAAGQTIAGSVLARVGTDGKVRVFTSNATHLVVDVAGWLDAAPGSSIDSAAGCEDESGAPTDPDRGLGTTATVRVTRREGDAVWFEITDTSRRNLTTGLGITSPTLDRRVIYVKAFYPALDNGQPGPGTAPRVAITGHYRSGVEPIGCEYRMGGSEDVHVCIAFPLMDNTVVPVSVGWSDIPNHAVDISLVLDAILADPSLVGRVSRSKITYAGGSMGGISGMYLMHPQSRDTRFAAIMSGVGFAPPWVPAFSDPATWANGPKVLMENTLDDPIITYELARLTYQNANSPNVTLISYFSGQHTIPGDCQAARTYKDQWLRHVLDGAPAPDASVFNGSTCAALGVQPGGTTGYGSAEAFRPR